MPPIQRRSPGSIRDAIVRSLMKHSPDDRNVDEILADVNNILQDEVPRSSVRSYLNLNTTPKGKATFTRTARGRYRLVKR